MSLFVSVFREPIISAANPVISEKVHLLPSPLYLKLHYYYFNENSVFKGVFIPKNGHDPFPKITQFIYFFQDSFNSPGSKSSKTNKTYSLHLDWSFSHLRLGKEALSLVKEDPLFFWARSGSILGSTSA